MAKTRHTSSRYTASTLGEPAARMTPLTWESSQIVEQAQFAEMSQAEYEGQAALAGCIPGSVSDPVAWGRLGAGSFFMTRFRRLAAPSPLPLRRQLLGLLETLHKASASPTAMFGFHVTTYYGPPPIPNAWTPSWEVFFTRLFRANLEYAREARRARGEHEDPGLDAVAEEFVRTVIPRLLRPLQSGGRSIKPTLCRACFPVTNGVVWLYVHSYSAWRLSHGLDVKLIIER